jgi:hypothetical protein
LRQSDLCHSVIFSSLVRPRNFCEGFAVTTQPYNACPTRFQWQKRFLPAHKRP